MSDAQSDKTPSPTRGLLQAILTSPSAWGWSLLLIVLASMVAWRWFIPGILEMPGLVAFHDHVVLPVALKAVYGHWGILWLCVLACAFILLLRPYGPRWRWFVLVVALLVSCGWVVMYEMWYNSFVSTAVLTLVLLYVVSCYVWVFIVRLPVLGVILGRLMYDSIKRYLESHS